MVNRPGQGRIAKTVAAANLTAFATMKALLLTLLSGSVLLAADVTNAVPDRVQGTPTERSSASTSHVKHATSKESHKQAKSSKKDKKAKESGTKHASKSSKSKPAKTPVTDPASSTAPAPIPVPSLDPKP